MSNEGIAYIKKEFQLEKTVPGDETAVNSETSVIFNKPEDDDVAADQARTLNETESSGKKRKKITGRNNGPRGKKRILDEIKICGKVASGEECPYGENCRYSHDLQAFLAIKSPDIGNVCPEFALYGHCEYGYKCRFLNAHITSDGKLITHNTSMVSQTLNTLSKDTQKKLRAAKYDTPLSDIYIEKMMASADVQRKRNDEEHQRKLEGTLFFFQQREEQSSYDTEEEHNVGPVVIARDNKNRVDFRNKLYLAPLTTVGNLPFRRICKEFGADITCGEMAMAVNLLQGQQSEWALMKRHISEDIFGVQICGNKPDILIKTAEMLNKEIQVDFVDLNCGCPIDLVYRKGAGSALLDSSSRLSKIIRGMDQVLDCPVTVKLRTGTKENVMMAHKLLPKFESWGVGLTILHGRSRQQRYTKLAKWDYIAECKKMVKEMTFFGNGDILSYEDYYLNKDQSNVDGIMIGRGALMKPWLFDEIKTRRHWDISSTERLEILKKFCNYGLEHWGSDTQGVNITRRFFCEWQSFLYRYIPVGLLEVIPQKMNQRPVPYFGRDDLETLMASNKSSDWVKLSEMFLGPTPEDFRFIPKHKSNSFEEGEG